MKNAKTMFRVMNEFKRTEKPIQNNIVKNNNFNNDSVIIQKEPDTKQESNYITSDNGPTFFI